MRKTVFIILVFISALLLLIRFAVNPLVRSLGFDQKAGLKISSTPKAKVFLDGAEVGETPFEDKTLSAKSYHIKLEEEKGSWEGEVSISAGTMAVVNRELGEGITDSSGEILTLNPGTGVTVVSNPDQADLEVDQKPMGKTPVTLTDLTAGEHIFVLSHSGFLKRVIKAYVPEGLSLNIFVDLGLSEVDLAAIPVSSQATQTEVVIKSTPTGFLRVREKPSTSSKEVGRVNTKDVLPVLEELTGWYKVKLPNDLEGYISSAYATKK
jgi:hypothetical protein